MKKSKRGKKNNLLFSLLKSRFRKWPELESNQRHKDFQSSALPTELSGQVRKEKDSQYDHFSATLFSIYFQPVQNRLQEPL